MRDGCPPVFPPGRRATRLSGKASRRLPHRRRQARVRKRPRSAGSRVVRRGVVGLGCGRRAAGGGAPVPEPGEAQEPGRPHALPVPALRRVDHLRQYRLRREPDQQLVVEFQRRGQRASGLECPGLQPLPHPVGAAKAERGAHPPPPGRQLARYRCRDRPGAGRRGRKSAPGSPIPRSGSSASVSGTSRDS